MLLEDGAELGASELRCPLATMPIEDGEAGVRTGSAEVVLDHVLHKHAFAVRTTKKCRAIGKKVAAQNNSKKVIKPELRRDKIRFKNRNARHAATTVYSFDCETYPVFLLASVLGLADANTIAGIAHRLVGTGPHGEPPLKGDVATDLRSHWRQVELHWSDRLKTAEWCLLQRLRQLLLLLLRHLLHLGLAHGRDRKLQWVAGRLGDVLNCTARLLIVVAGRGGGGEEWCQ